MQLWADRANEKVAVDRPGSGAAQLGTVACIASLAKTLAAIFHFIGVHQRQSAAGQAFAGSHDVPESIDKPTEPHPHATNGCFQEFTCPTIGSVPAKRAMPRLSQNTSHVQKTAICVIPLRRDTRTTLHRRSLNPKTGPLRHPANVQHEKLSREPQAR